MTIQSRWSAPIEKCSLPHWIFGSACGPLSDKKLYIDPERPETHFLTKSDYRLLAKRVALGLLDAGLQRGDRVLLFSPNHLCFPPLFLGILMAGGIFTGANPSYVPRELAHQLSDSGARFMVTEAGSLPTALETANMVGLPASQIYVLDRFEDTPANIAQTNSVPRPTSTTESIRSGQEKHGLQGVHHWMDLVDGNLKRAETWEWTEPADPETTTCCLNYSSGTTGVPKGVEISHHSYVANGTGVVAMAKQAPDDEEVRKRSIGLCFLPLYHVYGQSYYVATFAYREVTTYMMPRFDFEKMLQHIQRFRVTGLTLVPPIAVALSKHPLARRYDLSSIETVNCGAAPLSNDSAVAVERLWPPERGIVLRQGWGMTEVTCTCLGWGHTTKKNGEGQPVGELVPNCAARLVEVPEDGSSVSGGRPPVFITEPNRPGELWVTGPTLLRSYWHRPDDTAATVYVDPADGIRWLRTGDIAYVDRYEPGALFFIVDRLKELIKVKGNQVAPAELEALLLERPDISDAAVVGVRIDGEERPRAYVVRVPGSKATGDEIARWMATRTSPFKRLAGGVVFVDNIPKNPVRISRLFLLS
ncbi:4-coumarate-CoA ligase [Grosmannia clavigera kw1407]|uniref:4-coumarate-CoA ligase n=1 Tax=Grosmannia clavigera (strain kw1407 / UAMH 11150) TaxID=655863 RepID=F0XFW0_GROCL|nr:4-coumarate-CoA ligase [Grosmannia clavigera kw1407]EFX04716.1 4-coumarate-CoA ligase [Grosmannia clavigera kw1407]